VHHPPLNSAQNPLGPLWNDLQLSEREANSLLSCLVAVVTRDPTTNQTKVIGTGFIVGGSESLLIVVSAAHVLLETLDKHIPPLAHALRGVVGDAEDVMGRLGKAVDRKLFGAFVYKSPTVALRTYPIYCDVSGVSTSHIVRELDVILITLKLPQGVDGSSFGVCPIDVDPFALGVTTSVVIAGFVSGQSTPKSSESPTPIDEQHLTLCVRTGFVAELDQNPYGFRCSMFRLTIPTEPGMSGGPVLLLVPNLRDQPSSGQALHSTLAAVAVISRELSTSPLQLTHSSFGETWASPIVSAYRLTVPTGEKTGFGDAVRLGWISSSGLNAKRAHFALTPDGKSWAIQYHD
jgi:hypothetical protein